MRINKLLLIGLTAFLVFSCDNDDDNTAETVPPRDRGEQAIEDDQALIEYLSTHFYNYEEFENSSEGFDNVVRFDTISGENADKTPIIDSDKLVTKTVNNEGVDQQIYILKVREGVGAKPKFTDSTYVTYQGQLLTNDVFDGNLKTPVWFNLVAYLVRNSTGSFVPTGGTITGFNEGLQEFGGASGFEVNADNTIKWNDDYGIGAVFIPSGLAYFNSPPSIAIPEYAPLIFKINMFRVNEADHDGDGIPSYLEDLDGDDDIFSDDSDDDGLPNHSDADDDGDGTLTRDEITINEDGSISFTDSNNDGTPDYLDPDVFQ
ncbi:hypothetical protein [Gramella sp. MAR_2010_147]|uniref:FKBP-type peptidyl-prolyl cis-trans isomerase n=1 Tax=Gramella sp. MAR_2010_147 TaxID=1250205 RepID=UPI00087B1A10|nr:hypothetical protein [Gramella sp. MAR_2010_147]SDS68976.1 hypothetical protein SAMN04488553_2860 [Gramella sp. MAR_2010_147]